MILGWWAASADAKDSIQGDNPAPPQLPDLHAADGSPGRFHLDGHQASIGYDAHAMKWDARVDGYLNGNPSLSVDYGTLITGRLGTGMAVTHGSDRSEVLLKGVYAPTPDVRIRVAGSQLRSTPDAYADPAAATVMQNSYLLGIRKHWDRRALSPDIGVAAYAAQADTAAGSTPDSSGGQLAGYMLDLRMRPTSNSKLEWRHDLGRLARQLDRHTHSEQLASANRIRYSHRLDNCMQLQGRVSAGAHVNRLDLGVARRNWRVGVSHSLDGDTALNVGYVMALGGTQRQARGCAGAADSGRRFEPVVDSALKRPAQLPQQPVTQSNSALDAGAIAEP